MMRRLVWLLSLIPAVAYASYFVCANILAAGANYYVSPTGNDSNLCTWATPCLTINTVVAKMVPGDVLYLRGGTYSQRVYVGVSGTASKPITISAFATESPILDGTSVSMSALPDYSPAMEVNANYVTVYGLTIQNWNLGNSSQTTYHSGDGLQVDWGTNNVTVNKVNVNNVFAGAIIMQANYGIVENSIAYETNLNNCRFSNLNNCGTPGCVNAASYSGLGSSAGCNAGEFSGGGWSGTIDASAPELHPTEIVQNVTLKNNVVHDNWGEGIITYDSNNVTISNNVSYNNFSQNLYESNSTNTTFNANLAYNTGTGTASGAASYNSGGDAYWATDSYYSFPGFNPTDEINGAGSTIYNYTTGLKVTNNFLYNVPTSFFGYTSSTTPGASGLVNGTIAFNDIISTVATTQTGATFIAWQTGSSFYNVYNCNSVSENNIVFGLGVIYGHTVAYTDNSYCSNGTTDLIYFNNNYYETISAVPSVIRGGANYGTNNDVYNSTNPIVAGVLTAGMSRASSYFLLKSGSAAINAGVAISGITTDYFGNAMQSPPNIGGYQ